MFELIKKFLDPDRSYIDYIDGNSHISDMYISTHLDLVACARDGSLTPVELGSRGTRCCGPGTGGGSGSGTRVRTA